MGCDQALVALGSASVALMVVDGQCGCTTLDEEIAAFLRKLPRVPVVRLPPKSWTSQPFRELAFIGIPLLR